MRYKGLIACTMALWFITGAIVAPSGSSFADAQRITFRTDDGVSLGGTWYEASSPSAPAVIFVHMLQRSRGDWDAVASRLAAEGIAALTFDLRGHGDSGGTMPQDFATVVPDVQVARRFIATRGSASQRRLGLAGASLGATVAAIAAAEDGSIASVALLSPSLEYRGVRIDPALRKYGQRPALLVASREDPYAVRSARELQKAGGGTRELLLLDDAGHGTGMLLRAPHLMGALVDWFKRTLL